MAQGVIAPPGGGDENDIGHQAHGHHTPHYAADQVCMATLHQAHHLNRVADAEIAMHADAGEEENAAVKVGIEEEACKFAGNHTEWPVTPVGIVVYEGGQGEYIEEV